MKTLNARILLLNASYEAHEVITGRHALSLLRRGVVLPVEPGGGQVKSGREVHLLPSVLRLIHYIDIRGRQRKASSKRNRILTRDRLRCQYCNMRGGPEELTIDHILPSSRGGTNAPENLVTACFRCNQIKGDRTPEEARMPLLRNPKTLAYGLDREIFRHEAEARPEWKQYLFLASSMESVT